MKITRKKLAVMILICAGVVAWSPPTGEDWIVGSGNSVTSSGSDITGVIGKYNSVTAIDSLVVGDSNSVTVGENPFARFSIISGVSNVLAGRGDSNLVTGNLNSVRASYSLVSGANNTVRGGTINSLTSYSAAIGASNLVLSGTGWALGTENVVTGDYAVALGTSNEVSAPYSWALGGGLKVNQGNGVAVGRWNAPMQPGDVFAVGIGNPENPATGLRVTSDGGVILKRAQGDISMGIYH